MGYTQETFGKKIKDCSKEELGLYYKYLYQKHHPESVDLYKDTKCYKKYGKRLKDLDDAERKELQRSYYYNSNKYKNRTESTFCFQYFGKRCKELTPEERTEFLRIRGKISRERKKLGCSLGRGSNQKVIIEDDLVYYMGGITCEKTNS